MTSRRELLIGIGVGILAVPTRSFSQKSGRIPRVGLLWIDTDNPSKFATALREGLRTQGYIEGQNIFIDESSLVDRYDRIPAAASRLVSEKVDVIVCYGATATQAARKATTTIPIVAASGGSDPVKLGMAASLSRPGGNFTGLTSIGGELSGKRIELLKELVPGMRRLAVVLYPESAGETASLRSSEEAARALNLEVRPVEIRTADEINQAIAGIARLNVQAIAFVGSTLFNANLKQIVTAVEKVRLPTIYAYSEFSHAGGLLTYAANFADLFRRSAIYVDKILKGAKPGDIPIEQPTKFELIVNLKTAKNLGIKIPQSILVRADRVIE